MNLKCGLLKGSTAIQRSKHVSILVIRLNLLTNILISKRDYAVALIGNVEITGFGMINYVHGDMFC